MTAEGVQAFQVQMVSTSRKRKSDIDLASPKAKKRMSSSAVHTISEDEQFEGTRRASTRSLRASSRISQTLQTQPIVEGAHDLTNPVKDSELTSPSTKSLSQTSTASQTLHSPSTAASSIGLDENLTWNSPTKDGLNSTKPNPHQTQRIPVEHGRTRSSSVSSNEDSTRSSGRTRKPTTKAKALADEGTMFYRSLRQTSDTVDDVGGSKTDEIASAVIAEPETPSSVQPVVAELDESVVVSVEAPPTRTSPRQRRATPKAAATILETDRVTRKRKSSPMHVNRASKSVRISSAAPDKPSKLRHPILSAEEEQESQHTGSELRESARTRPETTREKVVAEECKVCPLKDCMEEQWRLLAFADFAADDFSDEDNDEEFEALLAAAQETTGPSSISQRIFEAHCVCPPSISTKKTGNGTQEPAMSEAAGSEPPRGKVDETDVENLVPTKNNPQPAIDILPNQEIREADPSTSVQDNAQLSAADPSSQEQGDSEKSSGIDFPKTNLSRQAILDSLTPEQKWYLTRRQKTQDGEAFLAECTPEDWVEGDQRSRNDQTHYEAMDDQRYGITAEINAAHAEMQAKLEKEGREKKLQDFQRNQAVVEQSFSTATPPKTQPAVEMNEWAKRFDTQHNKEISAQAGETSEGRPLVIPDVSTLLANTDDKNSIAPVQAGAKATVTEKRESKRKSVPTQRMKILAASSAKTSVKVNKRDSTGVSRTRGHQNTPPGPRTSANDVEKEAPSMMEREPRPSKKITLKFRTSLMSA